MSILTWKVSLLSVVMFAYTSESLAQAPPPSSIAPIKYDLDNDGLIDAIISEPTWNSATGRITLTLTTKPDTPIVFVGAAQDDYFGWSVCIIPNDNHSSGLILAIGVPGGDVSGVVLLYELNQIQWGKYPTAEQLPRQTLRPVIESDSWFGFDIAPSFDVDNNGVVDMRIASQFTSNGVQNVRTSIYDAWIGVPVAVITPDDVTPLSVPRPKSDTTLNGLVDDEDLLMIIELLGTESSTILTGDVNGDGQTNNEDLVQVLSDLGDSFLESEVQGIDCEDLWGCGAERVRLPTGGACLSWLTCESQVANLVFDSTVPIETLTPNQFFEWLWVQQNLACKDKIIDCLDNECVVYAINQIKNSCFGNTEHPEYDDLTERRRWGEIYCVPGNCSEEPSLTNYPNGEEKLGAVTTIHCEKYPVGNGPPRPEIIIKFINTNCTNFDDELCRTLAHELLHVAQRCQLGWLTKSCEEARMLDNEFFSDARNVLCMELDVLTQLSTLDNCGSLYGDTDCQVACKSVEIGHPQWAIDNDCVSFCNSCGTCCQGFRWLPHEEGCPTDPCLSVSH